MRVSAFSVHGTAGWPSAGLQNVSSQLTAVCGPTHSGKSTIAGLIGHALFGKPDPAAVTGAAPEGELIVEASGARYRLRRVRDERRNLRLTIAALDGSAVDHSTTRQLVGGLTPTVLGPLCAVSFRETPQVAQLLSTEFAEGFKSISGDAGPQCSRRAAELAARRDLLAQELESRIATERRTSGDLETQWRDLDRRMKVEQDQLSALEDRLQSVEKSLAETDARLRYRRLELNVELRWRADEGQEPETTLTELDSQVERCRTMLAELGAREALVRGRLAHVQTARTGTSAIADQQTWLAVSRQLAADLSGEVSRLARASASKQCVCHDSHPRLRPIAETIDRQLAVLEECIQDQRKALSATELQTEIDGLARTQTELRNHLEHLLARRQAHTFGARSARQDVTATSLGFSAADAEILERRRIELEQERFQLVDQVNAAASSVKAIRAERDAVERQRAALLSARSIEHVHRELAAVQHKLEQALGSVGASLPLDHVQAAADHSRASDYLAQLTNGDLVKLVLMGKDRHACAVNREGATAAVEQLSGAHRDQAYIAMCLALHAAASRRGVWLPLILDEPFERLDARSAAALVAVLDVFCQQGHQVIVFTRKQEAMDRLVSVGASVHSIASLRRSNGDIEPVAATPAPVAAMPVAPPKQVIVKKTKRVRSAEVRSTDGSIVTPHRKKKPPTDRSDAA